MSQRADPAPSKPAAKPAQPDQRPTDRADGDREPRKSKRDGPCIEVEDVHVSFGDHHVLQGVSVLVDHGETVVLMGESGGGKTVLLKVMLSLLAPDRGRVRLFGHDVAGLDDDALIPIRKRCAVVFQGGALYSALTVEENVAFALREALELADDEVEKRVKEAIEAVALHDLDPNQIPEELSGGMRKRLAVARAVALKPEVIVYDEPTSGLDPPNSAKIFDLVGELHDRLGVTSVVVTHDVAGAERIASRILFLGGGKIVFDGTPEEFRSCDVPVLVEFRESAQEVPPESAAAKGDGKPAIRRDADRSGG